MASAGNSDHDGRDLPKDFDDRLRERLSDLDRKLDGGQKHEVLSDREVRRRSTALGKAFRLSTELVAGVFGGGVIGWLLDQWLGTMPWLLIIFLMLGLAAGLLNAIRTAKQMSGAE
jgi:ATP synthase protein I